MKKIILSFIVSLITLFGMHSCSKSESSNSSVTDTDEYYADSSGRYVLELGEDGFNIYEDGKLFKGASNSQKEYMNQYKGVCVFPAPWGPRKQVDISNLPVKTSKPGKTTITKNLRSLGMPYRISPKPNFLGGTNYSCYECLIDGIERDDFYLGVCNGSIIMSGSLSDDPSMQSAKSSLSQINFNPSQSDQFVQTISSSGIYKCSRRY